MSRIYLSPPQTTPEEKSLVQDALDSNWLAPVGPHIDAFELEFAARVDVPHAVALASGTAALHLGLEGVGVRRGDTVITSTLTFAATANAVTYLGATPAFVDVSPDTWTMDPDSLEEELERQDRRGTLPTAVLTVDLYGQCADYAAITEVCARFGVPIVEDAAEALGGEYSGQPAGGFGECAAFSFNGNKIITTSGGGMLVSKNRDLIDRARYLASQARDEAPHYQHSEVGYNYRLSNILAALGRGQLMNLDNKLTRRRDNNDFYRSELGDLPGLSFMPEADYGVSNCWLTCILVEPSLFGATREDLRLRLEALDIESRPVWKPMHLQPAFRNCGARGGEVAERLFKQGLCLPSGSGLTDTERERVIEGILSTVRTETNAQAATGSEHVQIA